MTHVNMRTLQSSPQRRRAERIVKGSQPGECVNTALIDAYLASNNVTARAFSERLGYARSFVSALRAGRPASFAIRYRIAKTIGVTVDELTVKS